MIYKQCTLYLLLIGVMPWMLSGCYSPQRLKSTRLVHLQEIQGLQYMVFDVNDPEYNVWALSNVQLFSDHLTARFDHVSEAFSEKIDQTRRDHHYKSLKDFVFIYADSAALAQIQNQAENRLDYGHITKTVVYEPDTTRTSGLACLGILGGAGLYVAGLFLNYLFL
ncbi:MAG TPA: hypothetical protein VK168_06265 [Saprospiraceae bacterium]|nr:hypothetical protein [Saprospiraceae bacterium]